MKKFTDKIKKYLPTKRKLIQLYCALLFNANFKGFATGNIYQGKTKIVCAPGINCYSCPGAVAACPLGSLQGSFSANKSTIYYVGGIILLYCILFGRMICGWFCPFGLIQELLHKIKTPKLKKNKVTRILSYFKYVVLVFFVLIVPIIYAFRDTPLPAFCKYICPAGTIEGGVSLLANEVNSSYFAMLGPLFTWKFLLMVSILVGSIFIFRLFCRFICPLGALYGLFNKISVFGVKVDEPKCTHCNLCVNHCKVDIKHVGDQECISCGECVKVCPTNAIVWKGPKLFSKKDETPGDAVEGHKTARLITRTVISVLLVTLLAGAVIYYWNEDSGPNQLPNNVEQNGDNDNAEDLMEGNEVGNLCYGSDLEIVDGNGITGETVNPVKTGKITIINFWGTWCTPCVNELPYFDQIATNYEDSVSVIAVHTDMVSDTEPEYLSKYYADSKIIFAKDLEGEGYYSMLGGRGTYPYTVVINADGVILKIFVEALEYEDLQSVVEEELNSGNATSVQGNAVGNLCYGADLEIVDGNGITGETVNPAETGKITIINFWGTWCTPCVNELPYFDQIAYEYEDSVSVIAVHTDMVANTESEYLAKYYADSKITFAKDLKGEEFYTALGGRGTYPYTVVIDENGVILKIFVEALEYEDLKEVVDSQLKG